MSIAGLLNLNKLSFEEDPWENEGPVSFQSPRRQSHAKRNMFHSLGPRSALAQQIQGLSRKLSTEFNVNSKGSRSCGYNLQSSRVEICPDAEVRAQSYSPLRTGHLQTTRSPAEKSPLSQDKDGDRNEEDPIAQMSTKKTLSSRLGFLRRTLLRKGKRRHSEQPVEEGIPRPTGNT